MGNNLRGHCAVSIYWCQLTPTQDFFSLMWLKFSMASGQHWQLWLCWPPLFWSVVFLESNFLKVTTAHCPRFEVSPHILAWDFSFFIYTYSQCFCFSLHNANPFRPAVFIIVSILHILMENWPTLVCRPEAHDGSTQEPDKSGPTSGSWSSHETMCQDTEENIWMAEAPG